jgi:hypothetical protein
LYLGFTGSLSSTSIVVEDAGDPAGWVWLTAPGAGLGVAPNGRFKGPEYWWVREELVFEDEGS